jgi:hypothetical protein
MTDTMLPQVTKSFEERMMDMMKENSGNLFTPEDLKKIVEKGIEKLYFEPRLASSNYGRNDFKSSLSEELVSKFMQEQVRIAITEWIKNNPEKILPIIETAIQGGIIKCIGNTVESFFQNTFYQFGEMLKQQIRSEPR